ncbi:MAG: hypothetical protein Kow0090_05750 [Myxococcota bacterium]
MTKRTIPLSLLLTTFIACGEGGDLGSVKKSRDEGDAGSDDGGAPARADVVVSAPGDKGSGLYDANKAINGVRGGGRYKGSADTFSLGYEAGSDNYIILRFSGRRVVNGEGVDFVVFENPFVSAKNEEEFFMDLTIVYLSRDGENWVAFPHNYINGDESVYSANPAMWRGFAGVQPVYYHEEENRVDPFDFDSAGGDRFDLDELPSDGGEAEAIKRKGFVYMKLVSAPSQVNPDTGENYVRDAISNGADIDGVYARYFEKE